MSASDEVKHRNHTFSLSSASDMLYLHCFSLFQCLLCSCRAEREFAGDCGKTSLEKERRLAEASPDPDLSMMTGS